MEDSRKDVSHKKVKMRAHLIGFNDTSSEEFWKKLVVGAQKCSLISF